MPGVRDKPGYKRQTRCGNAHRCCAKLSQCACAGWPRQNPRHVQHVHAGQWACAGRQRLWVAVADLRDFHHRAAREELALVACIPLLRRAYHCATNPCVSKGRFELSPGAFAHRVGGGIGSVFDFQQIQYCCGVMREASMQVDEAIVC